MKHIFLVILLTLPFSAIAMDEPGYSIPESIAAHRQEVSALCSATYAMLKPFRRKDLKITCTEKLISVIDQMSALKSAQPPVTEKEIGFFIYKTKPIKFIEIFNESTDHIFAAVFFGRLEQYYEDIMKNKQTSPNTQQINNYIKKMDIEAIALKNRNHNIIIPQTTLNEICIPTPDGVAVELCNTFMNDIPPILSYHNGEIEWTFKLIYHEELKGKTTKTSIN